MSVNIKENNTLIRCVGNASGGSGGSNIIIDWERYVSQSQEPNELVE